MLQKKLIFLPIESSPPTKQKTKQGIVWKILLFVIALVLCGSWFFYSFMKEGTPGLGIRGNGCLDEYYKTGDTCTGCATCGTGTTETTSCSSASNRVCTQNVCSCTNGVAATGTACTTNGTNTCSSCTDEYYNIGDTCTGCATCGTGTRETTACSSSSNRVCTQNVCSCTNGTEATGTACTTHGANICLTCSSGYYKTGDTCTGCAAACGTGTRETTSCSSSSNRVCTQNVCSCTNGVAATGTACTTHDAHICSSCPSEYYKTDNTCTGCTTACGTGTRETTSCSSSSNRVCTQNVCSCTNGTEATGTACTTHGANICLTCSSGYMLLDSFCVPLQSHDTVHNNVLTTVDVCDASAKATCTSANKEECSEGVNSKDCGNCSTGFKQDSEVSTSCVDICDTAAIIECSNVHRDACSHGSDDCGGCSVNYESYGGMPCELVGGNNGGIPS